MTDAELIQEFLEVETDNQNHTHIFVKMIEWDGQRPYTTPIRAITLKKRPTQERLDREFQKILGYKKYFQVCSECGERNPVGWMLTEMGICQQCGTNNHGIVY
jgi:ribosomal protein L40E